MNTDTDSPTKRGRPRKYDTPEEAKMAKHKIQNAYFCNRYKNDPEFREHVKQMKKDKYQRIKDDLKAKYALRKKKLQREQNVICERNKNDRKEFKGEPLDVLVIYI
jgi:hypothetical protein